jgi:hypothetical protein
MPFAPTDLANLWGWYKADAGVTGTTSVTAWDDQSGNGNNLAATTGQEPVLVTSGLNSKPTIKQNSSFNARMATAIDFPDLSAGGTIYLVAKQVKTHSAINFDEGGVFIGAGNTVDMQIYRGNLVNSLSIAGGINTDSDHVTDMTASDNTFYTIRLRYDGTNVYQSLDDGTENSVASSGGGYIPTPLTMFYSLAGAAGDKEIAELIIYTENHDATKQAQVEYYLQQRYMHYSWTGSVPSSDTTAVINFPAPPTKTVGDADFAPGATSNSPAPITYSSFNTSVATIVGGNIHIVGAGSSTITASQEATTGYTAAADVMQTLTVNSSNNNSNSSNMATNEVQADVLGLWISTVLTSPQPTDWLELVCAENTGLSGSRDVNKKRTKCGVIKGFGPIDWQITGSGTTNTTPGTGKLSGNEVIDLAQNETPILVKVAHGTDTSLYYRQGQGQITKFNETANTGDPLSFDFTIDVSGLIDTTP